MAGPKARPAIVFDHVQDAALNGLSVQGTQQAESALRFIETQDVLLTAERLLASATVFVQVEGPASAAITIDGGVLAKAGERVSFKAGARRESVKERGA